MSAIGGNFFALNYSVRSATTGSFFAALLDGISPEKRVKNTLIATSISAAPMGKDAFRFAIPVSAWSTRLIGMQVRYVKRIPMRPDARPMMMVSALNMLDTSLFDAPIARRIPISFVLSCTEMSVITPIIIDDTTSDTATNAIST